MTTNSDAPLVAFTFKADPFGRTTIAIKHELPSDEGERVLQAVMARFNEDGLLVMIRHAMAGVLAQYPQATAHIEREKLVTEKEQVAL
jgi:hypothetical protein